MAKKNNLMINKHLFLNNISGRVKPCCHLLAAEILHTDSTQIPVNTAALIIEIVLLERIDG